MGPPPSKPRTARLCAFQGCGISISPLLQRSQSVQYRQSATAIPDRPAEQVRRPPAHRAAWTGRAATFDAIPLLGALVGKSCLAYRAVDAARTRQAPESPPATKQRSRSCRDTIVPLHQVSVLSVDSGYPGTGNGLLTHHRAGLGHAGLVHPGCAADRPAQVALGQGSYRRTPGAAVCPLATG